MPTFEPYLDASTPDAPVRGFLHRAADPNADGLILTHGAGANCQAPLLVALAEAFCATGITVLRCDLPFRQSRPSGPPPRGSAERDQAGLSAAVVSMRRETAGRIFLGGHSYGGRQASMLAAAEPTLVDALLLLSYPLHPPKRPDQLRTSHFPNLKTPTLFVHGARDGFATHAEMEAARALIPARAELLSIPSAGHELMNPRNRAELPPDVVRTFLHFIDVAKSSIEKESAQQLSALGASAPQFPAILRRKPRRKADEVE
jgi:predicted alpha/beta-hydrolase family hydrolase